MKIIIIVLLLLALTLPAFAQENDYWQGDSDGLVTMDTWRWFDMESLDFIEAWLRFDHSPILVWSNPPDIQSEIDLAYALDAIMPYISIQRIDDPALADIQIRFTYEDELKDAYGISRFQITKEARLLSLVVIEAYHSTCSLILHELIHALGVRVHSPYGDDIMHSPIWRDCSLSQRDINTLLRLYALPAVNDAQLLDYVSRRN